MLTFFAFFGVLFFVVIAATLTETEHFGWATITFILSFGGVQLLHTFGMLDFNFWSFVVAHKAQSVLFVPAYVVTGVLWSFAKWTLYLFKFKEKFLEAKKKYLVDNKFPLNTVLNYDFFKSLKSNEKFDGDYYCSRSFDMNLLNRPNASDNKTRIMFWLSLWPISFLGTLVNDPVRRFFNWLFKILKDVYQKISNHIFKDLEELK